MNNVIILIGIIFGVSWRIGMPFFRKVMDGKLTLDEFDIKYIYEGIGTLAYATPIGILLFFQFAPPEASTFIVFLAAFAWGYTMQNLTDGAPAWLKPILVKLRIMKPKKPDNPGTDNPESNNPGPDNPGPNKERSNVSKLVDWFLGRNGSDPTKRAEARLELIVLAPIQFFLLRAIWDLAEATSTRDWEVAGNLFGYIWKMMLISIVILWGRNGRSWVNIHMTDWLTDRQSRKAKEAEFRAKLDSTEGIILSVQDAVKLIGHTQNLLKELPTIPLPPTVPSPPADQPEA